MASLKEAARSVISEARDGICWIAVYKDGRSWNAECVWIDYDERSKCFQNVDSEDVARCCEILSIDPDAVLVNGYYCNIGPLEEMTVQTLADGLRFQYETVGGSTLADFVEKNTPA